METAKVYQVGDYYNEGVREGVVFEISEDGLHGHKMIYSEQSCLFFVIFEAKNQYRSICVEL